MSVSGIFTISASAVWGGHSESSRPHNRQHRDERKFVRGAPEFTFFRARPRLGRLRERKALTFLPLLFGASQRSSQRTSTIDNRAARRRGFSREPRAHSAQENNKKIYDCFDNPKIIYIFAAELYKTYDNGYIQIIFN